MRENLEAFPIEILKRLVIQLDPSQPCAMPFLRAIYQNDKDSSGTDSNIGYLDYEAVHGCTTVMKDLVETFLFVILSLTARLGAIRWVRWCEKATFNEIAVE